MKNSEKMRKIVGWASHRKVVCIPNRVPIHLLDTMQIGDTRVIGNCIKHGEPIFIQKIGDGVYTVHQYCCYLPDEDFSVEKCKYK